MKLFAFIMIILSIFFNLSAQVYNDTKEVYDCGKYENLEECSKWMVEKPPAYKRSKWSILWIGGSGNATSEIRRNNYRTGLFVIPFLATSSSTVSDLYLPFLATSFNMRRNYSGNTSNYQFKAEYMPNNFGIQFGISGKNINFKSQGGIKDFLMPYMILMGLKDTLSSAATTSFPLAFSAMIFGSNYALSSFDPIGFSIPFVDVAPTYHIFPRERMDIFMGVGGGIGACGSGCSAYKGFAKAGLRYNFDDFYVFIEKEIQKISIKPSQYQVRTVTDDPLSFGAGLFF